MRVMRLVIVIGIFLIFVWTVEAVEGVCTRYLGFSQKDESKSKPPMVEPKVTHHDEQQVQHYDRVEITCPEGYEGHFVDVNPGFDGWYGVSLEYFGSPQPGYAICFSKEFMDEIRKNPELFRPRPAPPKPV